jgi:hypothetical protein
MVRQAQKQPFPGIPLLSLELRPASTARGEGIGARCDWRTTGAHRLFKPRNALSSVTQAEDTPGRLGGNSPGTHVGAELRFPIGNQGHAGRFGMKRNVRASSAQFRIPRPRGDPSLVTTQEKC